ncbi:AGR260Wp [Eremothecium gossypii ATCC 10895]|uniref:AGR260Wp n=1 Tax=Eremothecium gossypii (strain ATCC 10895 / CBS 109.51 / FGSC 9923 / NRRL Y-1056) TaxID=284811 RepID=Q74ZD9_EREGS|nr:AGR260Wp [Eremothecium gossypii ATCC 10895]AAS54750.2 AGR260Wp [Eremothecium gossypii ATCC 10895]
MSEINSIIHRVNVLVSKLPKEKDAGLEKECALIKFGGMVSNRESGLLFGELAQQMDRTAVLRQPWIVEFVVRLGNELCRRGEVGESFWGKILGAKFSRNVAVHGRLVEALLDGALSRTAPCAWQNMALLLKLYYELPEYRNVVASLLRSHYARMVGSLLDCIHDFQLCNYVVELLSNVFARKSTTKPGVSMPPHLWENEEKNKQFFDSAEYPYKGKHGEAAVISFIWNRFGPFFTNFVRVRNIRCVMANGRSKPLSKSAWYHLQVIYNKIYMWDGEGTFLQLDTTTVEIMRDLKEHVRMKLLLPFEDAVSSPHTVMLTTLGNVKSFDLEFHDECMEDVFLNATKVRKVSEVQSFITLKFPSSFDDEILESSMPTTSHHQDLTTQDVLGGLVDAMDDRRDQEDDIDSQQPLDVLPLIGCDSPVSNLPRITGVARSEDADEWDLGQSSITPNKLEIHSVQTPTTHRVRVLEEEQSPLIMLQKRRLARNGSRTLATATINHDQELQLEVPDREAASPAIEHEQATSKTGLDETSRTVDAQTGTPQTKNTLKRPAKELANNSTSDSRSANVSVVGMSTAKGNKTEKSRLPMGLEALENIFALPVSKPKRQKRNGNKEPALHDKTGKPIKNAGSGSTKKKAAQPAKSNNVAVEQQLKVPAPPPVGLEPPASQTPNQEQVIKTPKTPIKVHNTRAKRKRLSDQTATAKSPTVANVRTDLEPSTIDPHTPVRIPTLRGAGIAASSLAPVNLSMKQQDMMESTTIVNTSSAFPCSYTSKLQDQIFSSITAFSGDLTRKLAIINEEMNNKIVHELSQKYQRLFHDLHERFQQDINGMVSMVGEFNELLQLPEDELVKAIRSKQFT